MSALALALNRFGLGARPDDAPPADPRRWLLEQFERYEPLPPAWAAQRRTGLQFADYAEQRRMVREAEAANRQQAQQQLRREARASYVSAVGARMQSALATPAPFVERLVHFWSNHFAVSVDKLLVVNLAGAYEADAIRPHVLGRFEDMLLAVVRHPAMLLYLDQAQSLGPDSMAGRRAAERNPERRRGLNENLAREILELHTLGVRSGYSQADVTEFARALTGWSVPLLPTLAGASDNAFQYRPRLHEPGPRTVLGRSYAQADDDQALAILRDLARHPATARHVATKLARHFIADAPPASAVQRLEQAFLESGGDLPAVYRALLEAPEAWSAPAPKFKTPWEWSVSALRALGMREARAPQVAAMLQQLGQPTWRPGSPAGFDDVAAHWAAPDALLRRVEMAQRLAALAGDRIDARVLAPRVLPGVLGDATAQAIARADSSASGLALLLVAPEFLRR